jgi:hypothetical protein
MVLNEENHNVLKKLFIYFKAFLSNAPDQVWSYGKVTKTYINKLKSFTTSKI